MRKSVIFIISIIYVVSIVVVTFFGMKIRMEQFPIIFDTVSITSYDEIVSGKKYLTIPYDESEGYASTFITYKYTPDNVTNPEKVRFTIDGNNEYEDEYGVKHKYADISNMGELVIYKRFRQVKVTITTTDDGRLSDTVRVYCE